MRAPRQESELLRLKRCDREGAEKGTSLCFYLSESSRMMDKSARCHRKQVVWTALK